MDEDKLKVPELLLALYLVDYYRYSFSVRSQGLFAAGKFDTPEVRELVNLIMWRGGGMAEAMKTDHAGGLNNVIHHNAKELKERISRVRDGNVSTHILEEIDRFNTEMTAADVLMGYLLDGR